MKMHASRHHSCQGNNKIGKVGKETRFLFSVLEQIAVQCGCVVPPLCSFGFGSRLVGLLVVFLLPASAQSQSQAYTFTTLAGTAGRSGGADGTGTAAQFNFPNDVAVDSAGNVYVADFGNSTIRTIT